MNNLKYYKFVVELSENSFKILYIMIRIIYIKFLSYFDKIRIEKFLFLKL